MAPTQINALISRKQLLITEADRHRQELSDESSRLQARRATANEFVQRHRWWLLGAAVVFGSVLTRGWRNLAGWLPPLVAAGNALLQTRSH
jgi:hypothetical protein